MYGRVTPLIIIPFQMSFRQFKPPTSCFEVCDERREGEKMGNKEYSMEQYQYAMYCLYEQNRYLQHEFMRCKYNQMLEEQKKGNENLNQIKVEEQLNGFEKYSSEHHLTDDIEKHAMDSNTKGTLRRIGNKITRTKPQKNQTKNIPKNYGKAIISFIQNKKEIVKKVVSQYSTMTYLSFMNLLKLKKNTISSIADLRNFWLNNHQQDFSKCVRILSNIFLRHYSMQYIFNSRISNFSGHVKYRSRLIQALRNPQCFTSIKQY